MNKVQVRRAPGISGAVVSIVTDGAEASKGFTD